MNAPHTATLASTGRIRRFVRLVVHDRAGLTAATVALSVGLGLSEGLGMILLVPLMRSIGLPVEHGEIGRIQQIIATGFAAVGLKLTLAAVLLLFLVVAGLRGAFVVAQSVLTRRLLFDMLYGIRDDLYRAVLCARWPFLARKRGGAIAHA